VVLAEGTKATPELKKKLNEVVRNQIGSFAVPDTIHWAPGEPFGVSFMGFSNLLFWFTISIANACFGRQHSGLCAWPPDSAHRQLGQQHLLTASRQQL
jgi:hypothetical protein